ncbi:hypothetical protein GGTG_04641 [Gaeumannomyces tritici R3-111a-1]|uniref:Fungal N-terminal domain-containing protein n=1 Tax=Gaeumannomyces tritici (strain R3-111a-1) TaxID=644352 RepID=J3NTP1_GAET3|nr:hypothetical protein GGTG_04641 [Gaeumannomyces tritici R3-111a-1]EJT79556.1 hypothetical protein GGTG_04641 [Gaeumannomyces tritici R3-111a-1]
MDPVTIVGMISGIITFIDFGIKATRAAASARQGVDVVVPNLGGLDHILGDIRRKSDQASKDLSATEQWKNLSSLISESEKLHTKLHAAVLKLEVPSGPGSGAGKEPGSRQRHSSGKGISASSGVVWSPWIAA